MKLRVVAIPLVAAICLGSPSLASPTNEEQMVKGRGARDRNGGGSSGGTSSGGTASSGGERRAGGGDRDNGGSQPRAGVTRGDTERRDAARENNRGDRDDQRVAVQRRDRDRNNGGRDNPRIVIRQRPDVNINLGSFRGPRYYSPAYYDRWARSYYRWSPIGYAPWSLIYGSLGFSNFNFYGGLGSPYYYGNGSYGYGNYGYGNYGYSGYPPYASGYDTGQVRLMIRPRDAEVFVDGYYAGLVDDFDGRFQSLRLDSGGHKIEVRMPGYEELVMDVHVQPGRTLTLAEVMRPRP